MHRLNGEEAGFLYLELPEQPINIVVMAILSPASKSNQNNDYEVSKALISKSLLAQRLGVAILGLPILSAHVVEVPFGLNHPMMVQDPNFDIADHIDEHILDGNTQSSQREQLDRLCAKLSEEHLDRSRALWKCTLVHGLQGGRQALIFQIHHCLMDGFALMNALDELFKAMGETETKSCTTPSSAALDIKPTQTKWELLKDGIWDQRKNVRNFPSLIVRAIRGYLALRREGKQLFPKVPRPMIDTPPCALNNAFTPQRTFAHGALNLESVKYVKNAQDVTFNDVILAIAGGGFRRYLVRRNQLPTRPLITGVPVGLDSPQGARRTSGNHISSLNTSLATDLEDPLERLRVISQTAANAKRALELFGSELLPDALNLLPPFLALPGVRWNFAQRRDHRDKAFLNSVISSVQGSATHCKIGSYRIDELYFGGPPNNGVGAMIVMHSYASQLLFTITCFADAVENPSELVLDFQDALSELVSHCDK